jgi:hypothetical protein
LRLTELAKGTECRDEVDPIPQGRKHFVGERGIGLIEDDQPDGSAAQQQQEKANRMMPTAAPFPNADDTKTWLIDTEDPHGYLG